MSKKMSWDNLLNDNRFRGHSEKRSKFDGRNEFESDYSRIIFSSSFRRLQDKAQVFPLEKSDFVRTRLTHTYEVAAICKSIGISVEKEMLKRNYINEEHISKIRTVLETAGLIHDLGNPPFGHFGEEAFQNFFRKWLENNREYSDQLTDSQEQDLNKFDGNPQTFRIATRLQYLIDEEGDNNNYGFNLTYGTLATILKYPHSSIDGNRDDNLGVGYKKFGYFTSESNIFEQVKAKTGFGSRHPLTFLLEAADDIAYIAADIEDGFKKGVINLEIIRNELMDVFSFETEREQELINKIDKYAKEVHENYPEPNEIVVKRLRIKVQGFLIESVVKAFVNKENYNKIIRGNFKNTLLDVCNCHKIYKAFDKIAKKHIFGYNEIIEKELVADEVISGLMKKFISSVIKREEDRNEKEKRLYKTISKNYRFILENFLSAVDGEGNPSLYDKILLLTDFVCGMTDSYALNLYQKLSGVNL